MGGTPRGAGRRSTSPAPVLRRVGRLPLRVARRLRRTLGPDPVPVEIVLDGGGLLNWRSSDPAVRALVLRPTGPGRALRSPRRDRPGPPSGTSALDGWDGEGYRLEVVRGGGRTRPAHVVVDARSATRNEAVDGTGARWSLRPADGPGARLVREAPGAGGPQVLALNAVLGVVTLTVGPLAEGDHLVLRRRGSTDAIPVPARETAEGDRRTFTLGTRAWSVLPLDPEGDDTPAPDGPTVWDVGVRGPALDVPRLGWGGSGIREPRTALRFRRSVSHAPGGRAVSVRPYWTTGQRLSVEVHALTPLRGTAS